MLCMLFMNKGSSLNLDLTIYSNYVMIMIMIMSIYVYMHVCMSFSKTNVMDHMYVCMYVCM